MSKQDVLSKTLYHATTEENSTKILNNKKIRPIKVHQNIIFQGKRQKFIKKDPGSLGYGFYLFSDYHLANNFMTEKLSSSPARVLQFKIEIYKNNMLDLTNENQLQLYNEYKYKVGETPVIKEAKKAIKNSRSGQSALEGFIIDYYINNFLKKVSAEEKKVLTIRCVRAFTTTQISQSRGSFVANGVEYCLKDRDLVADIKQS